MYIKLCSYILKKTGKKLKEGEAEENFKRSIPLLPPPRKILDGLQKMQVVPSYHQLKSPQRVVFSSGFKHSQFQKCMCALASLQSIKASLLRIVLY